jgi:hypothetical protein
MAASRLRRFPDVTFGAAIEGIGWAPHAWTEDGIPTCRWNRAPAGLGTRRQLRELGLAPGGHPPVAALRRRPGGRLFAWLYRFDLAVAKRAATPAVLAALDKAVAAWRTCPTCARDTGACPPRSLGECFNCWQAHQHARDLAATRIGVAA